MARNRRGYDVRGLTIRRLISEGWFSGESAHRMAEIGAMTIDGRLLIDEPYMMRSDNVNEIRLAQKSSELMLAAGALWRERTAAFASCESPDFIVRLADGRLIGVEGDRGCC